MFITIRVRLLRIYGVAKTEQMLVEHRTSVEQHIRVACEKATSEVRTIGFVCLYRHIGLNEALSN